MLGVIIITITNKDGTKSRIEVPDDSKVEITKSEISDPKGWHGWPADAPPPAIAPFNAEQAKQHQKAWAKYLNIDVEYTNSIGMKFRLIPPGEFMMGSTAAEIEEALIKYADKDKMYQHMIKSQAPQHKVILTQPIYLGVNEVTQAEYEKVMGVNPSYFSPMGGGKDAVAGMDTGSHPVEMVSWNDAAEFCAKLSKQEELKPFYLRADETVIPLNGTGYRLPTEAEWEYACRAGTTTKYWIGDKEEDLLRAGWLATNAGVRTYAAGELKANPYGLCDIHGNVSEFVQDMWDLDYYSEFAKTPASDPVNPHSDTFPRVIRGGHAAHDAVGCRAAYREAYPFASPAGHIGFRVALTVTGRPKPAGPAMPKSVATTPSTPAVAGPIDFAAERKAAEWVLSVGGSVQTIDEAGVIVGVEPGGKLPDGQWQLNTVWLTNCKNIKSGALDKLASCRSLITLNARATNMGDADCQAIGRITNLESLDLTGSSQITNTGIKNLAPLRKLRTLGLTFLPISDEAMDVIAGMTELRSLEFGESGVGDEGLAKLKTLDKLEQIALAPNITDRGLVHLTDFPNLAFVGVKAHQVTDVGVANLRKLPKLDSLLVVSATDADLERLKTLAHLKNLTLIGPQFSASSVETLQAFPQLEILNLNGSATNDSHLVALSKLKKLRQLFVDGTSVTPEGIAKFRELRPDVELRAGGKMYPAVAGPIDYEAERKAAEWAIGRKVAFQISTAEGLVQPTDLAQLPNGPFHVHYLDLTAQPNLTKTDVEMIGQLRKLKTLNLRETQVDDSSLAGISQLTELENLDLLKTRVTDAGLAALAGLRNLKRLELSFTAVTDDGIGSVAALTSLRVLGLGECQVGDEGLAKLKSLCHLEQIHLGGHVTDQGLKHIADFPNLTSVAGLKSHHLTETGISHLQQLKKCTSMNVVAATDEDLIRLKSLTNLKTVAFNLNQFTVSGLETLQAFPQLDFVSLNGCANIDDSHLVALSKLKTLRQLFVEGTSVTPEGIAKFRELRPDVELSAGGKVYPAVAGPIDYEAERKAAEWVLSVGGELNTMNEAGGWVHVTPGGELPDGRWHLRLVWFTNYKNINSGDLERLASCRNLKVLSVRGASIGDADCMAIGRMANLEVLGLLGCSQITNAGIKNLGPLRKLHHLDLAFTPISDEAMDVIAGMTELRTLALNETQVTDVGFKKLAPLVLLEDLAPSPGVTDQGLSILGNFPQLKLLGLKGHQITDISVAQLQKLPKLTTFSLVAGTDENLPKMKGLTQLRWLGLNLCQFTEQGFQTLLDFKWLQTVNIGGDPKFDDTRLMSLSEITDLKLVLFDKSSSVSPKGIENFRAARPDVRVNDGVQDYPATSSIPFSVLQQLDETDPLPKWELPAGSPLPVVAPCSPEDAAALQQKWAEHLKRPVVEADKLDMKFALIPPGEFRKIFTRPRDPAIEPDMPVRRFRITKPYALSTTEVTWDQFRQFVEATGYQTEAETNGLGGREFNPDPKINWRTPGWKPAPNEPVTQVTPRDAEAFCAWLTDPSSNPKSKIENRKFLYRLPTEAEWVHACRAGSVHKHVVGPEPGDLADYAWTQEFLDPDPQASPLHLVAQKKPNPFGLHDTLGNVWEYTRDSLSPSLVPYLPTNDPVSYGAGNSLGSNYGETQPAVHTDWGWVGWNTPQNNQGFRVLKQFDGEPLPGPLDRPLVLRAGQPLSVHALVPRPEKIPGLQSWSLELAGLHSPYTTAIAVSPKGDIIATGSIITGKISLWDRDGNYQRALLGHEGNVKSLDFSPDGRWLASSEMVFGDRGTSGNTVRVWNVETGTQQAVIPILGWGNRIAFSPRGDQLAVSIEHFGSLLVIDLVTGGSRAPAINIPTVRGLAWSPDGTELACSHGDSHLRVWDTKSLKVLRDVEAPVTTTLEWSPDGQWLALELSGGKVAIRETKTLEVIKTFDAPLIYPSTHALVWLPDSKRLAASAGAQGGVFDAVTGLRLTQFDTGNSGIALLEEGKQVIFEGGGRLLVHDTSTGQKLREGKERGGAGGRVTLAPNGRYGFSAGYNSVTVFDAGSGQRQRAFEIAEGGEWSTLQISPNSLVLLASTHWDGIPAQLLDTQTGKKRHELPRGKEVVVRSVWSPDGKWLATGATDKLVRVWNVASGKIEHELAGHTGTIGSLAWSPDGTRLASAAEDKTVRLWDPLTGKLVANYDQFPEAVDFNPHSSNGSKLAWTADSRRLWIALGVNIVPLDVETGTFGPLENFSNGNNVAFLNTSPDGQRLLAREKYGWTFVRGRDAQDRRLLGQHLGQTAQWHPDSRRFLGWEHAYGTVGFDVETNRRLGLLFPWLTGEHWLCIGPTGHYRGSPGVEDQFVYVAMLPDGSQRTYTPAEFAKTFGWKNDLDKATLLQLNP